MKLKNILLVFIVILNNSYAGTIIGNVSTGKGGKSVFGKSGKSGNIYNDKVTITKNKTNNNKELNVGVKLKKILNQVI